MPTANFITATNNAPATQVYVTGGEDYYEATTASNWLPYTSSNITAGASDTSLVWSYQYRDWVGFGSTNITAATAASTRRVYQSAIQRQLESWIFQWSGSNNVVPNLYSDQTRKAHRRAALRAQHTPMVALRNHRGGFARADQHSLEDISKQELVALGLLRQMVSAEDFREYLKRGVLSVRGGQSGWVYAVARYGHIAVYSRGDRIAELCVHLKHQAKTPPTDEVVAKLLMVELDEADLWKRSNVHYSRAASPTFDAALAKFGGAQKLVLVA